MARATAAGAGPARSALDPRSERGGGAAAPPRRSRAVDGFREGLIICDAHAVVRHLNPAAAGLLPEIEEGQPLSATTVAGLVDAVDADRDTAEFTHHGRTLRARRVRLRPDEWGWYVEDASEAVRLAQRLKAERAGWALLTAADRRLCSPTDEDRAARALVELAVPVLGDLAVLAWSPAAGRARWWRAVRNTGAVAAVDSGWLEADRLPAAVRDTLTGFDVELTGWLDEELAEIGWDEGLQRRVSGARVMPLCAPYAPAAALVVAGPEDGAAPDERIEIGQAFARRAAAAWETAALNRQQARLTEALQDSLAPATPVPVIGVEWGTAYRPARATPRIGADFLGAGPLPRGGAMFFLGSVSGEPMRGALTAGQARPAMAALRRIGAGPDRTLSLLNDIMIDALRDSGRFATAVVGSAHADPGGGLLLALAGGAHPHPLLLRGSGEVGPVRLGGQVLGVLDEPHPGRARIALAAGESCVLYSNAVVEAAGGHRGDEPYGAPRLGEALAGGTQLPAQALAERIEQQVTEWAGGHQDDLAVLIVRAAPATHETEARHGRDLRAPRRGRR